MPIERLPDSANPPDLECAAWIWHPQADREHGQFLEFELNLESDGEPLEFEASADQRFILFLDDREFGRGPDRSEVGGWSVHAYRLHPEPGPHRLHARVWWLPEKLRPMAQCTVQPGFALRDPAGRISTGSASWRVRTLGPWKPLPHPGRMGYHVIGCGFEWGPGLHPGPWMEPRTVHQGRRDLHGHLPGPWRLASSCLPEQHRSLFTGGSIRASFDQGVWRERPLTELQGLTRNEAVTLEPAETVDVIWDFGDYLCAYPRLHCRGGEGSRITLEWAESLFVDPDPEARKPKGQRDAVEGKHWHGFGDRFLPDGEESVFEIPWWRSGRFLRIHIEVGDAPLTVLDLRPLQTGYPYQRGWDFEADALSPEVMEVCERGLLRCVHETFVDCPYYEQMMYLGDTRIQALTWMTLCRDARPVRRALELFDRSRWVDGFCLERCPSWATQHSATYSLVYPLMLRDYAWWRRDPDTVRRLMPGVRAMLECALVHVGDNGLPDQLPGWLFVDWVSDHPFWVRGSPGAGEPERGLTSPVILHLPPALEAAAELEEAYGNPHLARRWREAGEQILKAALQRFWSAEQNALSDDAEGRFFSEHAQALALSCDALPPEKRNSLLAFLKHPPADAARASIYFSYHLLGHLLDAGEMEAFRERMAFWENLPAQGFLTTVEAPEPSRSDCHGWGAHPLHHALQGLAGIRPAAPGFAEVDIRPRLTTVTASLPHPDGTIHLDLGPEGGSLASPVPGTLRLPAGDIRFPPGTHRFKLSPEGPALLS